MDVQMLYKAKLHPIAVMLPLLIPLSGCASVMRGTSEQLHLYSAPAGATASLQDGQTCTTPCDLKIARGKPYNVTFTKDGCEIQTQLVSPHLAGSGAAEAAVFGVVGGAVDVADGAVYDSQPNPLSVNLNCKAPVAHVERAAAASSPADVAAQPSSKDK